MRAHVDAETMAAWADHALPAEEAAAVELHLSNCDRCQEVLAAFVRSAPTTGAVVIPFWARRPVQWSAAGLAAAAALVAMIWIGRPPAVQDPESTVASRSVAESASAPAELLRDKSASAAELRKEKSEAAANQAAAKRTEGRAATPAPPAVAAPPPRSSGAACGTRRRPVSTAPRARP